MCTYIVDVGGCCQEITNHVYLSCWIDGEIGQSQSITSGFIDDSFLEYTCKTFQLQYRTMGKNPELKVLINKHSVSCRQNINNFKFKCSNDFR